MIVKLKTIIRYIYRKAISLSLIREKNFLINNNLIKLTNLNESNLLKEIAINGFESYENEVVTLIKNYPWKLNSFFDIGANIGFYSILAECIHPKLNIVSVEPFPKNIKYIKKIKRINNLKFSLIEKAIDREQGIKKTFYFPVANNSSELSSTASLLNSFEGTNGAFNHLPYDTVEIDTVNLDSAVSSQEGPSLIKIDCEGNELNILESAQSVLERDDVDFIIEIMINDRDKNELFSLMNKYSYKGFLITNAGLVHEERPLTFPHPNRKNRTIWKNHFFTKKEISEVKEMSENYFGYWI